MAIEYMDRIFLFNVNHERKGKFIRIIPIGNSKATINISIAKLFTSFLSAMCDNDFMRNQFFSINFDRKWNC